MCQPISRRIISAASALVVAFCLDETCLFMIQQAREKREPDFGRPARLEKQKGLDIIQAEICDIRLDECGAVKEIVTKLGAVYAVQTAIICSGTFLHGRIYVGDVSYESGPDGLHAAVGLSEALERLGVHLRRFKTGTPARVRRDSIDYDKLEVQEGDEKIIPFSFETPREGLRNQVV